MTNAHRLLMRLPLRYRDDSGNEVVSSTTLACGHPRKYAPHDALTASRTRNVAEPCDECARIPHPVTNPAAWDEARRKRARR